MSRQAAWWCLFLLLLAPACGPAALAMPAPPALGRVAATALLLAAADARGAAFAAADPSPLRALFDEPAVAALAPRLAALRREGLRLEERDDARRLIHWAPTARGGEGVLDVQGEQRLTSPGGAARPWSRIARQWWAALGWSGARWLVMSSGDLPPGQWWNP